MIMCIFLQKLLRISRAIIKSQAPIHGCLVGDPAVDTVSISCGIDYSMTSRLFHVPASVTKEWTHFSW